MITWHFIIPFYFGRNAFVLPKGGAPVSRKLPYLKRTITSIQRLAPHSRITIFVCDDASRRRALEVHSSIEILSCHPRHLPLETVKHYQARFRQQGSDQDIVVFNEDDQILYLSESVMDDIKAESGKYVFSPHRWSRQFLFFRRKGRPVYTLDGRRGLLDNIDRQPSGPELHFHHRYQVQKSRHAAYAACWFMSGHVFRNLDLGVPAEKIELESASYAVFDSGLPVLKLRTDEKLSHFLVDHLSGYDYNKRLIK